MLLGLGGGRFWQIMKKLTIILLGTSLMFITSCAISRSSFTNGYFSYCTSINGYWDDWRKPIPYPNSLNLNTIRFYTSGDWGYFIMLHPRAHPSNYYIKVSYYLPSEKKVGNWYYYDGMIEYHMDDAKSTFPFKNWYSYFGFIIGLEKQYKKTSEASVRIQGIKAAKAHRGATFNVFFEGNAIGISGI